MVAHMLLTKLMDALFSIYTNLGTKMPKNDATITRKKDDATVKKSKKLIWVENHEIPSI